MPNNIAPFALDATLQSAVSVNGNGTVMNVGGLTGVTLQVTGAFVATINPEGTLDDATWPTPGLFFINLTTGIVAQTITAPGLYFIPTPGIDQFRTRVSGYVSGAVTVTAKGTNGPSPFLLVLSPPGSTPAPTSISAIGGTAMSLGQAAMAGSMPVVMASNQAAIPVSFSGIQNVTGSAVSITGGDVETNAQIQLLPEITPYNSGAPAAGVAPTQGSGAQALAGQFADAMGDQLEGMFALDQRERVRSERLEEWLKRLQMTMILLIKAPEMSPQDIIASVNADSASGEDPFDTQYVGDYQNTDVG